MTAEKKEKPRHLGRGLQSLIGPIITNFSEQQFGLMEPNKELNFLPDKELEQSLARIKINAITPNPYQPRQSWDDADLAELVESIRVNGVLQPIIVRPIGNKYELIAGERRFRAARLAGLESIPALVRQATDMQMLEIALIENIHRTDLNPIERAQAYQTYVNRFSLTHAEAAQRLGEDRSVISNYLRLLDLPEDIKKMVLGEQLSMGHARAILALPNDELRRKIANRAMAGRLSVREVERLVRNCTTRTSQPAVAAPPKAANIVDLENRLRTVLGTKVSIETRKSGQRGKIIIEFYSPDEFDRITERIGLTTIEEV